MSCAYRIEESARDDLRKLGPAVAAEIKDYLETRIKVAANPELFGKPLGGAKYVLWRYRVRHYRLVCRLEKRVLIVIAVAVGRRSNAYDD